MKIQLLVLSQQTGDVISGLKKKVAEERQNVTSLFEENA